MTQFVVSGTLLDIEHKAGTFTPDDAAPGSAPVSYDFYNLHVLDQEARRVRVIRVPRDVNPVLYGQMGQKVSVPVEVPDSWKLRAALPTPAEEKRAS